MSNKPTFDVTTLFWGRANADSDTESADITEPSSGKRQTGWTDQEKPPRVFFNWFWSRLARVVAWLVQNQVRNVEVTEFSTMVSEVEPGQVFRVGTGNPPPPLEIGYSTAGVVVAICTDGQRVFWSDGTQWVYCHDASTMVQLWASDDLNAGAGVTSLACDGATLFVGTDGGALGEELAAFDPTNGDLLQLHDYAGTAVVALATNGSKLAALLDTGAFDIYASTSANLDQPPLASGTHGAIGADIAIDYAQIYTVGQWAAGNKDTKAHLISTGAEVWSMQLATANPTTGGQRIDADGEAVYVTGVVDSGGNATHKVDRFGSALWGVTVGDISTEGMAVDDRFVYVADGVDLFALEKSDGHTVHKKVDADSFDQDLCSNGVCVFGGFYDASATASKLFLMYSGFGSKAFLRVESDWDRRRPFSTLAVPTE